MRVREAGRSKKFKLNDLSKYSSKLKYNDMNWKFTRSAMGKITPGGDGSLYVDKAKQVDLMAKLYKILKNTDWANTPIYH